MKRYFQRNQALKKLTAVSVGDTSIKKPRSNLLSNMETSGDDIINSSNQMLSSNFRFYRYNNRKVAIPDQYSRNDVNNSVEDDEFSNKPIQNLIRDARKEYIDSLKAQISHNREQINRLQSVNNRRPQRNSESYQNNVALNRSRVNYPP